MAKDPISSRFSKNQEKSKLGDLANKGRSRDDIQAEQEMIDNTEKVETIHAGGEPGRNEPCSCGSGKKFKKCCANK